MQRIKHLPRAWRRSAVLAFLILAVLALAACGQGPARHAGEWDTRVYANVSRWMGEGQPNQLTYPYYDGQNMHSDTSLLVPLPTDLCDVETLTARAWYLPLLSRWESSLLGVDGVVRFYTYTDGAGWAPSASLEPFALTGENPNDLTLLGYDRLGEQEALLCVMQRSTLQLRFLYTQDGRTWSTQAESSLEEIGVLDLVSQERPNDFLTPAVFFLTPQEGYLWGHGTARAVWRTADGGKTWKQAHPGTPEGLSVSEAALYHSFGIFSVNVLGGQPQLIVNGGDGSTFFLVERTGDGWRASCTGSLPLPTPTPATYGLAWQERYWACAKTPLPGHAASLEAFGPAGRVCQTDPSQQVETPLFPRQATGAYVPAAQRWDTAGCVDGTLTLWRAVAAGENNASRWRIAEEWEPQLPSAMADHPLKGVLDYEWFDANTAVLALLAGHPVLSFLYHPLVPYCALVALVFAVSYAIYWKTKDPRFRLYLSDAYVHVGLGIIVVNFLVKNYLLAAKAIDILEQLPGW